MNASELSFESRTPIAVAERHSETWRKYHYITAHRPKHDGIPCWGYDVFHLGYGCPARCGYCYLLSVLRKKVFPVYYTEYGRMGTEVTRWLDDPDTSRILHCGSLSDSLMMSIEYLKTILPLFDTDRDKYLVLVTKGWLPSKSMMKSPLKFFGDTFTENLKKHVILIYSLNAPDVAFMYERGAPDIATRLQQLYNLVDMGWRVRVRIDPVIPVRAWKEQYRLLVEMIADSAKMIGRDPSDCGIEAITMGAIRGTAVQMAICKNERDFSMPLDPDAQLEDNKYRLSEVTRSRMFSHVSSQLRLHLPCVRLSLCKENLEACKSYSPNLRCVCLP